MSIEHGGSDLRFVNGRYIGEQAAHGLGPEEEARLSEWEALRDGDREPVRDVDIPTMPVDEARARINRLHAEPLPFALAYQEVEPVLGTSETNGWRAGEETLPLGDRAFGVELEEEGDSLVGTEPVGLGLDEDDPMTSQF